VVLNWVHFISAPVYSLQNGNTRYRWDVSSLVLYSVTIVKFTKAGTSLNKLTGGHYLLDEQLIRELNQRLDGFTREITTVGANLIQCENSIIRLEKQINLIATNVDKNNITIARATGFVSGISLLVSITATIILRELNIIH
jgi:hypothetical protein